VLDTNTEQTEVNEGDLQEIMRASGYLTQGQAWDLASIVADFVKTRDKPTALYRAQEAGNGR
jgi:hypothetical protein